MRLALTILAGLLLAYAVLLTALWVGRPREHLLRESLRLLPDVVRLVKRLARDPTVPRRARLGLWLLLGYLVMPFDLVPDFIPVLGYADDVILVSLVLRWVVRTAPAGTIRRQWPGTEAGFAALTRVL